MADSRDTKPALGSKLKSIKSGEADLSNLVYGKLQPQSVPTEEAVLGAIMMDRDVFAFILDVLRPESFYKPSHQAIFKSMMDLFQKSLPIDILTVGEELKKAGKLDIVGGISYLTELTNRVASAANAEFHARIIAQKYIQRELIKVSTTVINDAFEDSKDVFQLLDDAEKNLFEIAEQNLNRGVQSLGALTSISLKELESMQEKGEGLTGIPTGFAELDRITSGFQRSDLIIVAARPGMGKTSLCLAYASHVAIKARMGVAFFSMEMSSEQLAKRLMSMESEINNRKLRDASLEEYEWQQLYLAKEKMTDAPLFIDDTPALNIFTLRAKARRLKMQHDIQLLIIDYLQLMSGSSDNKNRGNREQEISSISRGLKSLAKELNIPVIALSQLSRAVETRGGNKRPQLSDLRESGAIEQDADIVKFIWRPDYYELDDDMDVPKGMSEIIIAKHRNGSTGTVSVKFIDHLAKFVDYDELKFNELSGDDNINPIGNFETYSSKMNPNEDDPLPF